MARLRKARCGAVTFVQRFGSALNLNVHFHVLVPDGAWVPASGSTGGPYPTFRSEGVEGCTSNRPRHCRLPRPDAAGIPRAPAVGCSGASSPDGQVYLAECDRVAGTCRCLIDGVEVCTCTSAHPDSKYDCQPEAWGGTNCCWIAG